MPQFRKNSDLFDHLSLPLRVAQFRLIVLLDGHTFTGRFVSTLVHDGVGTFSQLFTVEKINLLTTTRSCEFFYDLDLFGRDVGGFTLLLLSSSSSWRDLKTPLGVARIQFTTSLRLGSMLVWCSLGLLHVEIVLICCLCGCGWLLVSVVGAVVVHRLVFQALRWLSL